MLNGSRSTRERARTLRRTMSLPEVQAVVCLIEAEALRGDYPSTSFAGPPPPPGED